MIRRLVMVLLVAICLLLGLALALAVNGRMAHLRALDAALPAGAALLPDWSLVIDDSAGILRGSAHPGGVEIGWRLQGIGRRGPVWRMRLDGPGLALEAPAVLSRAAAGEHGPVLALAPVTGEIGSFGPAQDGDILPEWPRARLQPTRGAARLDMARGRLAALEMEGLARDVVIDGNALGSGRFTLHQGSDAQWRLVATLRGAGAANGTDNDADTGFDAELRIDWSDRVAVLTLVPHEASAMPAPMPAAGLLRALPMPAPMTGSDQAR